MSAPVPAALRAWLLDQGWRVGAVDALRLRGTQTIRCDNGDGTPTEHTIPAHRIVAVHPDVVLIAGQNGCGQPYRQAYPRDPGAAWRTLCAVADAIPYAAWEKCLAAGTLAWPPIPTLRELGLAPPPVVPDAAPALPPPLEPRNEDRSTDLLGTCRETGPEPSEPATAGPGSDGAAHAADRQAPHADGPEPVPNPKAERTVGPGSPAPKTKAPKKAKPPQGALF